MDRCVEKELNLNPDKVCINIPNVPFFGQVLTPQGLKPDLHKIDVIQNWPTPTNTTELQSFLSDLCQPLQELLKSSNEFVLDTYP